MTKLDLLKIAHVIKAFNRLPTKSGFDTRVFKYGGTIYKSRHDWLSQKILDPVGIPHFEVPQASSDELSRAK